MSDITLHAGDIILRPAKLGEDEDGPFIDILDVEPDRSGQDPVVRVLIKDKRWNHPFKTQLSVVDPNTRNGVVCFIKGDLTEDWTHLEVISVRSHDGRKHTVLAEVREGGPNFLENLYSDRVQRRR